MLEHEGAVEALRQADDLQQHENRKVKSRDRRRATDAGALVIATAASRMFSDRPPGTSASITAACVASDTQAQRR